MMEELNELEAFFRSVDLPEQLQATPYALITDVRMMIESHLQTARHNYGKPTFDPYVQRLRKMKHIFDQQKKKL